MRLAENLSGVKRSSAAVSALADTCVAIRVVCLSLPLAAYRWLRPYDDYAHGWI
jgi:hypothetical protein